MILLLLALGGCGDPKGVDADADGSVSDADCDDADPAVNPGAAEACNGVDDNCDGAIDEGLPLSDWLPDGDGDGYGEGTPVSACAAPAGTAPSGGDCDDADATRYPGAPERCDGVDHDCDERVDEPSSTDATTVYRDADLDGYGGDAQTACPGAAGTATTGGDCDDADPQVSPAGIEACTPAGRDEDCDGQVDDADPTLAVGSSWWPDEDGDGFGSDDPVIACEAPAGSAPIDGDCDDADPRVYPAAPEPDCGDGMDLNCDGTINDLDRDGDGDGACTDCDDADDHVFPGAVEACNELDDDCDGAVDDGLATSVYYADTDGDGFGDAGVTAERCGGDPDWVAVAGDCDDTDSSTNPGAEELCSGTADDDCDGEVDEEDASGCHQWAQDADRDGYGDPAHVRCLCSSVGTYDVSVSSYGWVQDCDDTTATRAPDNADTCGDGFDASCDGLDGCAVDALPMVGHGADSGDEWAQATVAGDLTGDGAADLVIGVPGQASDEGTVEVHAGPWSFPLGAPTYTYSPDGGGALGTDVAAGDLDGDGVDDLVITAPYRDGAHVGQGALYVVRGPLTGGGTTVGLADLTVDGSSTGEAVGGAVALSDDLDGDGGPDIVVSSLYHGSRAEGAAWILPADWTGVYTESDAPVSITGSRANENFGAGVEAGADVDGDGADDLLVVGNNIVAVFLGPLSGSSTSGDADLTIHDGEYLAFGPFHFADDLDGDGVDDVLASGEAGTYLQTGLSPGRRASWAAWGVVIGSEEYLEAPTDVVTSDVDGDGETDLIVGSGDARLSSAFLGAVHVLLGPLSPGAIELAAGADAGWIGDATLTMLGERIHPLGDVDGAPGGEVLLWGESATGAASYAGSAWYLSAASLP